MEKDTEVKNRLNLFKDSLIKKFNNLKRYRMGFTSDYEVAYYEGKEAILYEVIEELDNILKVL